MNEAVIIKNAFIDDAKRNMLNEQDKTKLFISILEGMKKGKNNDKEN